MIGLMSTAPLSKPEIGKWQNRRMQWIEYNIESSENTVFW